MGLTALTVNGLSFPDTVNVDTLLLPLLPLSSSLTSLRLLNLARLTDAGVLSLRRLCPSLTHLSLHNCLALTPTAVNGLKVEDLEPAEGEEGRWSPATLTSLDLTKYRLANVRTLAQVSSFTALQRLVLRGCRELNDYAVGYVSHCRELRELDLSFCVLLTAEACNHLGASSTMVQSLRSLSLVSLELVTDVAMRHLAHLHLTSLDVSQCDQLTDRGLHHLTTGPCALTLTSLNLSWLPDITGAALLDFADLRTRFEASWEDRYDSRYDVGGEEEGEGEGEEEEEEEDEDGVDVSEMVEARRQSRMLMRKRDARRRDRGKEEEHGKCVPSEELWHALRRVDVTHCQEVDSGSKSVLIRTRPEVQLIWQ